MARQSYSTTHRRKLILRACCYLSVSFVNRVCLSPGHCLQTRAKIKEVFVLYDLAMRKRNQRGGSTRIYSCAHQLTCDASKLDFHRRSSLLFLIEWNEERFDDVAAGARGTLNTQSLKLHFREVKKTIGNETSAKKKKKKKEVSTTFIHS